MHPRTVLLWLLLATAATLTAAQGSTNTSTSLYDLLYPQLDNQVPNAPGNAIFPPSIFSVETPIAVRYALLVTAFVYDIQAACHPVALSFFGIKDPIPPAFCVVRADARGIIFAYSALRVLEGEFPQEAATWAQYMLSVGVSPKDASVDQSTPVGWGNALGYRHAEFFAKDGLNSLGDVTRTNYKQNFADSSGYTPLNGAHVPADLLKFPLRWQPLISSDRHGRFTTQIHVVPHIGSKIKPLLLSEEQFAARTVPSPYERPNSMNGLSRNDRKTMEGLLDELLETSATLTPSRVFYGRWWDNKFTSLGLFPGFYSKAAKFTEWEETKNGFGEMLAQWSAIELAWKEKVRLDLIRPTTMVRRFRSGQNITAYIDDSVGAGVVSGDEWEPLIPVQPHSEYPSASAVLCTASLEHTEVFLRHKLGPNATMPVYSQKFLPSQVTFPLAEPFTAEFATPAEAAKNCGMSRLWAGVHFSPSVPAGEALGTGVGKLAFDHVADLAAGRVPKACARCKK